METLSKKAVVETLEASRAYASQLESLLNSVAEAEDQVRKSAATARQQVEQTFEELKETVLKCLSRRQTELLQCVQTRHDEAMAPLEQCKEDILSRRVANNNLIIGAEQVLKSGGFKSDSMCLDFIERSAKLGALPAVPDLENVANITFEVDSNSPKSTFNSLVKNIGVVHSIAPVQITYIDAKPGALLIHWDEVFFECQSDSFESERYRLQVTACDATAVGSAALESFRDVYTGPEYEFLLRDVRPGEVYSFRVCCRLSRGWSTWSMVKCSKTEAEPFSWDPFDCRFLVSNENKLARVTESGSLLFSASAQVSVNDALQFTYLSAADPLEGEGVGLCVSNKLPSPSPIQTGVLFVSFNGDVYIDGKKKMILLPKMTRDGKITFMCENVNGKWRINIEIGAKAVTYEWQAQAKALYFAASLRQPEIQVLVE